MRVVDLWDGRQAVALQRAMRLSNEAFAAHLGIATRTVANWNDQPSVEPSPINQAALDTALLRSGEDVQSRFELLAQRKGAIPSPVTSLADCEASFAAAARESSTDALALAAGVGREGVEHLQIAATQLSRDYNVVPAITAFMEAREIRNVARQLVDMTRRPQVVADLYFVIGKVTALLGSIAFDLGYWDSAAPFGRSATTYAELAGHPSLEAWSRGLRATVAFWCWDPHAALEQIAAGLAVAPVGTPRRRLLCIAARAHAVRGDRGAVSRALASADQEAEFAHDRTSEQLDNLNGEFDFGDTRAAACAGAAWLQLGDGERAESSLRQGFGGSVDATGNFPPGALLAGVRLDIASARLLQNDLEGAMAFAAPVLALTSKLRIASISGRVEKMRQLVNGSPWSADGAALPLRTAVLSWRAADGLAARSPLRPMC